MAFLWSNETKRELTLLVFVKIKEDIAGEDLNTVVGH